VRTDGSECAAAIEVTFERMAAGIDRARDNWARQFLKNVPAHCGVGYEAAEYKAKRGLFDLTPPVP